jgi:hypothetical protein
MAELDDDNPLLKQMKHAAILRARLLRVAKTPCQSCGHVRTLADIANAIGLQRETFWKFARGKHHTLLSSNLKKLEEWLDKNELKTKAAGTTT